MQVIFYQNKQNRKHGDGQKYSCVYKLVQQFETVTLFAQVSIETLQAPWMSNDDPRCDSIKKKRL